MSKGLIKSFEFSVQEHITSFSGEVIYIIKSVKLIGEHEEKEVCMRASSMKIFYFYVDELNEDNLVALLFQSILGYKYKNITTRCIHSEDAESIGDEFVIKVNNEFTLTSLASVDHDS